MFSLVDPFNNQVIATATAQVVPPPPPSGTLSIPGNPFVPDGNGLATVVINYTSSVNANIYVGSTLFCSAPAGSGSCQTGEWVHEGMVFTLVDAANNATLATATAYVFADGTLNLSPNPIASSNGFGSTVVNYWSNVAADIYVGSTLFCSAPAGSGSCATGPWVTNGLVFRLIDRANGATLATTAAQVTSSGN